MSALTSLLDSRRVWRAQEAREETQAHQRERTLATGHVSLNAVLPGGGWPRGSVSELLSTGAGSGELALLWPLLARLTQADKPVLLVSPPAVPYPTAWRQAGVRLSRCHWLDVAGCDALWATEQSLRAGCCAAVVAWLPLADSRAMRRLQVAASSGDTPGFVLRGASRQQEASPAALRLRLHGRAGLEVIKCRGGWPPAGRIAFGDER
ncbi:translesion DNA synthesis-associated protein ImuA [Salinicola avicenniae]|uniref:translesion DNA synthesis-associated protein ImuA n=1 Tax=Salinicola avicenniae TaxID=2916836 RepID=UPI00207462BE|nr:MULTISPECIES: translesion DNA synthesis-associated protein ImuA [unclassified Salinicola]